ncbi:MAG TPA: phosphopantetheine-binding protein [Pseudonocardiaceae bacterium]|jgi:acyl carrier protein|nr:phosphopantetheine-binding protein [Pseudonocardiaceae bacterium]
MSTMHDQAIFDRIRGIVASVLEITEDDVWPAALFYEDLAADSLEKVEITVQIERHFGVQFAVDDAAELRSVADAVALLRRKGVATGPAEGGQ